MPPPDDASDEPQATAAADSAATQNQSDAPKANRPTASGYRLARVDARVLREPVRSVDEVHRRLGAYMLSMATDHQRLWRIKVAHTGVWIVVASAIFALYPAVAREAWSLFWWLHVLIGAEMLALATFGGKCPLTVLAERYTDDRRPNFDIFLPRAVAEHNKAIFTVILVGAWIFAWSRC